MLKTVAPQRLRFYIFFLYRRNLFNDSYAKDTSKKVRSVMKARGISGKHMGKPPYGYLSDSQDKDHWILDEEAAPVVKRIFDMTIAGIGPCRIARILEADKVPTVKALYAMRKGKPVPERPCHWHEQSVVGILERMEYTGCVCNFKTYSKSYKLKKRIPNARDDMFILPGTQEAIVPQEQWDRVQELRKNKRRITKGERQGLFSGLLFCADCGSKLNFATCKRFEGKQDRYVCAKYRSGRGTCSGHIIREEVLRDVVLARIRSALRRADRLKLSQGIQRSTYQIKDLTIDLARHQVLLGGEEIHFTQNEFKIIELLAIHAGKVLTYDFILEHIWGPYGGSGSNQILRVNMANIRRKLGENPSEPKYIHTELGIGYRMLDD